MNMLLGPTTFNLVTNLQEIETASEARFAEHSILGGPVVFEAVGQGKSEFSLGGVIFPERLGTDGGITKLKAAQGLQLPLPLMRGDFMPLGWVIIRSISSQEQRLNASGMGKKITFNAKLNFTGSPRGISMAQQIIRFLS